MKYYLFLKNINEYTFQKNTFKFCRLIFSNLKIEILFISSNYSENIFILTLHTCSYIYIDHVSNTKILYGLLYLQRTYFMSINIELVTCNNNNKAKIRSATRSAYVVNRNKKQSKITAIDTTTGGRNMLQLTADIISN